MISVRFSSDEVHQLGGSALWETATLLLENCSQGFVLRNIVFDYTQIGRRRGNQLMVGDCAGTLNVGQLTGPTQLWDWLMEKLVHTPQRCEIMVNNTGTTVRQKFFVHIGFPGQLVGRVDAEDLTMVYDVELPVSQITAVV